MKTGVVFEGGAVRTAYSCGVMDAWIEQGIDFDYLVGVSAGIAYGTSFISRQRGRNLEVLTKYAPDPRYMSFRNMLRPGNRGCYFGLKFGYEDLPFHLVPFDYEAFARDLRFDGYTETEHGVICICSPPNPPTTGRVFASPL